MHVLIESLCCTPETNIKLYINYISIKNNNNTVCLMVIDGQYHLDQCVPFCSLGHFYPAGRADPALSSFSAHVHHQHFWQLCHHHLDYLYSMPPNSHVHLSQQLGLGRHQLHLHHGPQDAAEHFLLYQGHFLHGLLNPDLFLHLLCSHGELPPGCDGL